MIKFLTFTVLALKFHSKKIKPSKNIKLYISIMGVCSINYLSTFPEVIKKLNLDLEIKTFYNKIKL